MDTVTTAPTAPALVFCGTDDDGIVEATVAPVVTGSTVVALDAAPATETEFDELPVANVCAAPAEIPRITGDSSLKSEVAALKRVMAAEP